VDLRVRKDIPISQEWIWIEAQLYKAVRAEHVKANKKKSQDQLRKAFGDNMPKDVADLSLGAPTATGKAVLSQSWQAKLRESTPTRAIRKMREKLTREAKKAAQGKHTPIIVQMTTAQSRRDGNAAPPLASTPLQRSSSSCAPASLHDPKGLAHVRAAYEFLDSAYQLHCRNCDEEWLVFDADWPQAGVPFAGSLAGKCETIERAGFKASTADVGLCRRCGSRTGYASMFSRENGQHLGERRPALSNLTWYEFLLVARVHPVVSVITLTATGLLCYAGHVCNYYVKVLEWFRELPAVLRDKKWFLIKRRRSIGATPGDRSQKKLKTANRRRLEAAFAGAKTVHAECFQR
jgi:hypothetical protein